jgi:alpha-glucosidase
MLTLYRQLIALRRARPALNRGSYEGLESEEEVLAYARTFDGQRVVVVLNFGANAAALSPALLPARSIVLASTVPTRAERIEDATLTLEPYEGIVVGQPAG